MFPLLSSTIVDGNLVSSDLMNFLYRLLNHHHSPCSAYCLHDDSRHDSTSVCSDAKLKSFISIWHIILSNWWLLKLLLAAIQTLRFPPVKSIIHHSHFTYRQLTTWSFILLVCCVRRRKTIVDGDSESDMSRLRKIAGMGNRQTDYSFIND